jgi:protein O-GlcNAc transferase
VSSQEILHIRDLIEQGELAEASSLLRRHLQSDSTRAEAQFLMGKLARLAGQIPTALNLVEAALTAEPKNLEYLSEQSVILTKLGDFEQLAECYRRMLGVDSSSVEAHEGLGRFHASRMQLEEAQHHLRIATELRPAATDLHNLLGLVQTEMGRFDEAAISFETCLAQQPAHAEALLRLGNARRRQGRPRETIELYKQALALNPRHSETLSALASYCSDICEADTAILSCDEKYREDVEVLSHMLSALNYASCVSSDLVSSAHFEWGRRLERSVSQRPIRLNHLEPHRPLRIGFVSADLCQHPVGRYLAILCSYLNAEAFVLHVYDNGSREDGVTQKLRSMVPNWRSIGNCTDERAADLIANDRIDILIDLSGHTRGHRLPLFALRAAPLQLSVFAYPNTTGLLAMDYRITDPFADPIGVTDHLYTEKLARFSKTAWVYLPPENAPEVAPAPFAKNGFVSFGCLNNPLKISLGAIQLWSAILKAAPHTRLMLFQIDDHHAGRLAAKFMAEGVARDQLIFVAIGPLSRYLEYFTNIDIALDPFPYNGGVSTCDALWMGVPVLTLEGRSYLSRQGVSVLTNVGLLEGVARSPAELLQKALRWANSPDEVAALRQSLRQRFSQSSLTDHQSYVAEFGKALREMWLAFVKERSGSR